jgi:hypothetical protein
MLAHVLCHFKQIYKVTQKALYASIYRPTFMVPSLSYRGFQYKHHITSAPHPN